MFEELLAKPIREQNIGWPQVDDAEARYLIDQFNKYAAWRLRGNELDLLHPSLVLSAAAFAFSLVALFMPYLVRPPIPIGTTWNWTIYYVIASCIVVVYFTAILQIREVKKEYSDFEQTLDMLEDYRSQHKRRLDALPDTVTLATIIRSNPKELRQLLGLPSEPSWWMKECVSCGNMIPLASEICGVCKTKQPEK